MLLKNLISGFVGVLLLACIGQGIFIYHAHFVDHSPKIRSNSDLTYNPGETIKFDAKSSESSSNQSWKVSDQVKSPLPLPGFTQALTPVDTTSFKGHDKGSVPPQGTLTLNQNFVANEPTAPQDLRPQPTLSFPELPGQSQGQFPPLKSDQINPPPISNKSNPGELSLPASPLPQGISPTNDPKPNPLPELPLLPELPPPGLGHGPVPTTNVATPNPQNSTAPLSPMPLEMPSLAPPNLSKDSIRKEEAIAQFVQTQQQLAHLLSPEELKKATELASRQLEERRKQKEKEQKEQNAFAALEKARKALKQVSHDFPDTDAGKKATQYLQTLENKILNFPDLPAPKNPPRNDSLPPFHDQTEPRKPVKDEPLLIPNASNLIPKGLDPLDPFTR